MKLRGDDLNDTINAPMRPDPKPLPVISKIQTLRKKHMDLVEQHAKAQEKREEAISLLRRRDDKVRDIRKALARSNLAIKAQQMLDAMPNTAPDDPVYSRLS